VIKSTSLVIFQSQENIGIICQLFRRRLIRFKQQDNG
jgi:hypothetical protein